MKLSSMTASALIGLAFLVACAGAFATPKAVVEPTKIDLGTIKVGEKGESSFTIRNEGTSPLKVENIQVSCPSCLVLDRDKIGQSIPPGGSVDFPVEYDSEGRFGPLGASIAVTFNDPEEPFAIIEIEVTVKALYITMPDGAYEFGLLPRGTDVTEPLRISAGEENTDMDLFDLRMTDASVSVRAEKTVVNEFTRISLFFTLENEAPLGMMRNAVTGRLRVGDEEVEFHMPVQGMVVGDIVVLPPKIVDTIRDYHQGEYISQITIRPSRPGQRCPQVLGAIAVGPLKTVIHPNPPENRYIVQVHAADAAPGGPRTGSIHIMTASKDEPIVTIPVYFKVAYPIVAQPENLVFSMANGVPPAQRVKLSGFNGQSFKIKEIVYETDLLEATVVNADSDPDSPGEIEITPTGLNDPNRAAATAVVITDCPGAQEFLIPILLQP